MRMIAVGLACVALFSLAMLYLVYDGYLRLLQMWRALARPEIPQYPPVVDAPALTTVIAVFNEAHQLGARIQNILDQDYPEDALDIVIASDGSTDDLAGVMADFAGKARVVASDERVGKSEIQNRAVETSSAAILLFSDASTRFSPGFLRAVVTPFADQQVGAVQGHLLFTAHGVDSPLASQGRYWRKELRIRQLESELGVLAVSSGACIATRRELWRPLDPTVGEDCVIPLDVVSQSSKVRYADSAVAVEPAPNDLEDLITNRARMTLRNWQGTWSRPALLNPLKHPGYAFALWCHKLLRWLSPIWLVMLTLSAALLPLAASAPIAWLPAAAMLAFYLCGTIGWVASASGRHVPGGTAIYVFILANAGFLAGLFKAARGTRITRYR